MIDGQGRNINYMRISITDRCNLRCAYCMPEGCEPAPETDLLSGEEICRIAEAGVRSGIVHYRLTGGEPLVRKDCAQLIAGIRSIPGVAGIGLTTNGMLLAGQAELLKQAGLDSVNVSLDTVDAAEFEQLTGICGLHRVLAGIRAAKEAGLTVKLNAVSQKETDWAALLDYAELEQLPMRFIELMPIGYGAACNGLSHEELLQQLTARYGTPKEVHAEDMRGHGPARYLQFPGYSQPVGFISALSNRFCDQCNRVRLTADGQLKLCLCYDRGVNLRPYLHDPDELQTVMEQAILQKPQLHHFEEREQITERRAMKDIGG